MDARFVGLTLEESIELAYEDEEVNSIFIELPKVNVLTDKESGNEDDVNDLDHLPGRQLRAQVEIRRINSDRNNTELDMEHKNTKLEERKIIFSWINGDFSPPQRNFQLQNFSEIEKMRPTEILEHIQNETKKNVLFKNCADYNTSKEEIKCFIGMIILSGYDCKPGKSYYWNSQADLGNVLVKNRKRRNIFEQIMKFIHLVDNNEIGPNDKPWKIRPLMNHLQTKFLQYFVPEEDLDYDESMVRYLGPIPFGFKMLCLNTKSGSLINFDLYQGKNPKNIHNDKVPYDAPFLIQMIRELPEEKQNYPYKLYTENLFTSLNLLEDMREKGILCTGTVREHRIPKDIPFTQKLTVKKDTKRRNYQTATDRNSGIIFVQWTDNNIVTTMSTCFGIKPLTNVKRYSQKDKAIVQVPRLCAVGKYSSSMGRTGLMKQNISRHRIAIRSKKWWWPLFTWILDASSKQLDFLRDVATTFMSTYGTHTKGDV